MLDGWEIHSYAIIPSHLDNVITCHSPEELHVNFYATVWVPLIPMDSFTAQKKQARTAH